MPNLSERASAERFLRPKQVQDILGIAASTLWNYVHCDVLTPSHRTVGGHARYRESEVVALKARLSATAEPVQQAVA